MTADRLVLWRHGETDWNRSGQFQGQTNIPLNDRGAAQAKDAAPFVAEYGPSAIWSSDSLRARQTAAALEALTGLETQQDQRLREIDVGTWAGLSIADVVAGDPAFGEAMRGERDYRRSPTGETCADVQHRIGPALQEIIDHEVGTVVVAGHGLALRLGIASLLGWDLATAFSVGPLTNAGWSVLTLRAGRWRLATHNWSV